MIRFLLLKSTQPGLFDFGTDPNPHHVGYTRVNAELAREARRLNNEQGA
jgi:hypothetical protein